MVGTQLMYVLCISLAKVKLFESIRYEQRPVHSD